MGVVYKKMGKNEKALEFYFKSLEENKEYHYTYLNISAIYIEDKEYRKTIDILSEGIDLNPYAEDLYYNRACCYSILDLEREAIKDIRKALVLNPSIIYWLRRDEDFHNLGKNKEFKHIIKEYGTEN